MSLNHEISASKVLESASDSPATDGQPVELSVVMPCLNERETVAVCVRKAIVALRDADIAGEVIVADNGSTDGSVEVAQAEGARVVKTSSRRDTATLSKAGSWPHAGCTC